MKVKKESRSGRDLRADKARVSPMRRSNDGALVTKARGRALLRLIN